MIAFKLLYFLIYAKKSFTHYLRFVASIINGSCLLYTFYLSVKSALILSKII